MKNILSFFREPGKLSMLFSSVNAQPEPDKLSAALDSLMGNDSIHSISEGLNEVNNIYDQMEDAYSGSESWHRIKKSAEEMFLEYQKNKRAKYGRFLIFYLYLLAREGYKFSSDQSSKVELYHAEANLRKIVSSINNNDSASELNSLWLSYLGAVTLDLEQTRRKHEVARVVSLTVEQKLKQLDTTINDAQSRAKNVQETVNNSLKSNNFVVLSKGFESLKEDILTKMSPLEARERMLRWVIIVLSAVFMVYKMFKITTIEELPSLLAPAIFIAVLIYFMRLTLNEKKVEQRRVHEIENKIAIIAFIEEYVRFYAKNKTSAEEVMNSFNNLIFHPIHREWGSDVEPKLYDSFDPIVSFAKRGKGEA